MVVKEAEVVDREESCKEKLVMLHGDLMVEWLTRAEELVVGSEAVLRRAEAC